jgi:hypothetical protein
MPKATRDTPHTATAAAADSAPHLGNRAGARRGIDQLAAEEDLHRVDHGQQCGEHAKGAEKQAGIMGMA